MPSTLLELNDFIRDYAENCLSSTLACGNGDDIDFNDKDWWNQYVEDITGEDPNFDFIEFMEQDMDEDDEDEEWTDTLPDSLYHEIRAYLKQTSVCRDVLIEEYVATILQENIHKWKANLLIDVGIHPTNGAVIGIVGNKRLILKSNQVRIVVSPSK